MRNREWMVDILDGYDGIIDVEHWPTEAQAFARADELVALGIERVVVSEKWEEPTRADPNATVIRFVGERT